MTQPGYIPINCDYYDRLEHWSTRQETVQIEFSDSSGRQIVTGVIADLFIKDKAEFLRLTNGFLIRLDLLNSVNGYVVPSPAEEYNG